jgi:hypothetical protein
MPFISAIPSIYPANNSENEAATICRRFSKHCGDVPRQKLQDNKNSP